jgi:uncharacterized membrane protein
MVLLSLFCLTGTPDMRGFFTKLWSTGIVGTFLAGLFVLLPIALTIVVLNWMVGNIASVLGPGSVLGELIASGGGTIVGANHKTLAFLAGLILALAIVWTIGAVVRTQAKQQLNRGIDRLVERLPVVRSIYKPVAQVVRLFASDEGKDFQGMSVVACRFGGSNGPDLLGLMTSPKTFVVAGERRHLVYLPTSPLPMSGGLVLIPAEKLVPMPEISVDELMQIFFSLGVVTPDSLSPDNAAVNDDRTLEG